MSVHKNLLAYIPVFHRGYDLLFQRHRDEVKNLVILGGSLIDEFITVAEEIRALPPSRAKLIVESLNLFKTIFVFESVNIGGLSGQPFIVARDALTEKVVEKYLPKSPIQWDSSFLRWDEKNVLSLENVKFDRLASSEFDQKMMLDAIIEGEKSSSWWRRVGAIVVRDEEVLLRAHNIHTPSEHTNYIEGDPRDFIEAGEKSELGTALHAEQLVIASAAKKGLKLDSTSLYVTVFPCPACAKLVAYSGIKKIFFKEGHASLDGERILRFRGVEIVKIK